jgi:hypothetical protein
VKTEARQLACGHGNTPVENQPYPTDLAGLVVGDAAT